MRPRKIRDLGSPNRTLFLQPLLGASGIVVNLLVLSKSILLVGSAVVSTCEDKASALFEPSACAVRDIFLLCVVST